MQPLVDDRVCTFTVERELPLWTPNCTHKHKYRDTHPSEQICVLFSGKKENELNYEQNNKTVSKKKQKEEKVGPHSGLAVTK